MQLSRAVDTYRIYSLADGYSPLTVAAYVSTLGLLVDYFKDCEVETIAEKDLQGFMGYIRNEYSTERVEQLSTASVHRYWKAIRSFWKWAEKELHTGRPDLVLTMPRWNNAEIIPYSEDEVQRLLKACSTSKTVRRKTAKKDYRLRMPFADRNRAMVLLMLDTGIRPGELSRLRVVDVNFTTGDVTIGPHQVGKTRPRLVPFGKSTAKALISYINSRKSVKDRDPLFLTDEGKAITRHTINSLVVDLGDRAAVSNPSPYRFRHTFAIQYLRNGGDVFTLQRILGHASLSTTKKYLMLLDSDAKTAHNRASPVDRWNLR